MMGCLKSDQGQLFYEFRLGDAVPEDHLVRKIDAAEIVVAIPCQHRHSLRQNCYWGIPRDRRVTNVRYCAR
jgi:hypothetical protein